MNTRRSTGSSSKKSNNYAAALNTKTITPELHAINAKICRLVENYPCMYDRSHAFYMRKSHIEYAWEEIATEMNDSVDNCKERFRNIRTSFARSINVQRRSNRVKPYYLSEELEFLRKHITPGVPVPVRGRRSRDSFRRGDDEFEDDDEDNPNAMLVVKQAPSSDENESDCSSERLPDEHALSSIYAHEQSRDSSRYEPKAEPQSHSDEDASKTTNFLEQQSHHLIPPKKRQRTVAESAKMTETPASSSSNIQSDATTLSESRPVAMDADDAFLHSLRPDLNHMNFHQKLYFKQRVYAVLGEIFGTVNSQQQQRLNGQTETIVAALSPQPQLIHYSRSGLQLPRLAPAPKPSHDG
ncbi:CG3919 [Drosophila busckii]|uniref:CG3919 n=1 Tax=Drosophila busckii TaxID=30019 RepID=A0A0M4F148_DROBS|nr:uncharacterized protein LOC108598694 [Drosophila busckii]ALC44582.1 CG3919 [Drosophila busckii]